jgi:predicted transposase YdaD
VLDCGLTVLPLAPICDVVPEQVPAVLMAISARLEQEASTEQASTLWNATRILMGLRYEEEQVDAIIEGVTAMLFGIRGIEESTVYQGILRRGEAKGRAEGEAKGRTEGLVEGEARGIRRALLTQGCKKLGPLDEKTGARIAAIHDLDHLELLLERIFDVSSWDELLAPDDASE